ncbi:MAG: hypothetical protein HYV63_29590 [Candidatus Schekmanbacteria bacterium]|nr:hypothetical protein [Candidatus Schekmanbacteria bacterium]
MNDLPWRFQRFMLTVGLLAVGLLMPWGQQSAHAACTAGAPYITSMTDNVGAFSILYLGKDIEFTVNGCNF